MDKDSLETPQWMFDILNAKFKFDVDLCATDENSKCETYCENIFQVSWFREGTKSAFMNPPYSKPLLFIKRALELKFKTLVMVLPVDTSTKWWNVLLNSTEDVDHIFSRKRDNGFLLTGYFSSLKFEESGTTILYFPKRVKFEYKGQPTKSGGQRPTCIVIVRNNEGL